MNFKEKNKIVITISVIALFILFIFNIKTTMNHLGESKHERSASELELRGFKLLSGCKNITNAEMDSLSLIQNKSKDEIMGRMLLECNGMLLKDKSIQSDHMNIVNRGNYYGFPRYVIEKYATVYLNNLFLPLIYTFIFLYFISLITSIKVENGDNYALRRKHLFQTMIYMFLVIPTIAVFLVSIYKPENIYFYWFILIYKIIAFFLFTYMLNAPIALQCEQIIKTVYPKQAVMDEDDLIENEKENKYIYEQIFLYGIRYLFAIAATVFIPIVITIF